jgi:site-specific DNA-methyltransferase (adenine-specific)
MTVTLHLGDCLEYMRTMPAGSVDAVITDPPYSSGGQFRGDRSAAPSLKYIQTTSVFTERAEFSGDNRDQRAFLTWATMWLSQSLRISKPGAVAMIFTDWRQLPTVTDAVQCGGWVWRNIVTWWKPGIRMQRGRFSSSAEYVVYCSSGVPTPGEKSPQNVLSIQPVGGENKEHLAEKPVELLRALIGATPAEATIFDPFMGSGTTGVACVQLGRNFIGCEIDPKYYAIAERRIHEATLQPQLFQTEKPTETQEGLL